MKKFYIPVYKCFVIVFFVVGNVGCSDFSSHNSYKLFAAGVLPVVCDPVTKKITSVILGNMIKISNKDNNKYCKVSVDSVVSLEQFDYFGGFADKGEDNSLIVAAREWHEESLLEKTLGWSLKSTQQFIKDNIVSTVILATKKEDKYTYGVMYIVNIGKNHKDNLIKYFNVIYNQELNNYIKQHNLYVDLHLQDDVNNKIKRPSQCTLEKNMIAEIDINAFISKINEQKNKTGNSELSILCNSKNKYNYSDQNVKIRDIVVQLTYSDAKKINFSVDNLIHIFGSEKMGVGFNDWELPSNDRNFLCDIVQLHSVEMTKEKIENSSCDWLIIGKWLTVSCIAILCVGSFLLIKKIRA
ncbi:MAG TPA: hypothetical protein VLB80_02435 [Candidatus Babeliales bacterium]|nr:hypothetical protein [Candidatus Babeliales bacterium]